MASETETTTESRTVTTNIITGTVKWFNVRSGYGFIKRDDNGDDIFVHQTAIIKNNPKKFLRSVGDGEVVEFIVIKGAKGLEAAQVTGPNGSAVQGSKYAREYNAERRGRYNRRGPPRRKPPAGQDSQGEERGPSDDPEDSPQQQEVRRRRTRRGGPVRYRYPPQQPYNDRPYRSRGPPRGPPPNDNPPTQYRRGPPRGRRGRGGGRGPPREPREQGEGYNQSRVYRPRRGRPYRRRGGGGYRTQQNNNDSVEEGDPPQDPQSDEGTEEQ